MPKIKLNKKAWSGNEFMTTTYVHQIYNDIRDNADDEEMQHAIYIDFLQDVILALAREKIVNPKHFAKVVHKVFKFKIPI